MTSRTIGSTQAVASPQAEPLAVYIRDVSSWIVIAFDLEWQAGEALEHLLELETINKIHIDHAVVISADDDGTHHVRDTSGPGLGVGVGIGGALGLAVGVLLPGGVFVAAAGAAAGAAVGAHAQQPHDNPLQGHLEDALRKGRSVLGVEYHDADRDAVLVELEEFDGEAIEGSLTPEQIAAVNNALHGEG
jgi:uncharacterized membrane protein